jgi:hypothetical protein
VTSCASVNGGFIMAPTVSGYSTFSQCSIDKMQSAIASASCVTPAEYADVTLDAGVTTVSGEGGAPFTLPFVVRSIGNVAAQSAAFSLTLPENAAFNIDSATSELGGCSVAAYTVTCELGSMPVDATAHISVVARSSGAAELRCRRRHGRQRPRHLEQQPADRRGYSVRDRRIAGSCRRARVKSHRRPSRSCRREIAALDGRAIGVGQSQPGGDLGQHGGVCHDECVVGELRDRRDSRGTTRRLTVRASTQVADRCSPARISARVGMATSSNNNATTTAQVQADADVRSPPERATASWRRRSSTSCPTRCASRGPLPTGDVA